MYRRDHFNEQLVVERCAELVAIEARVSEIDALLAGARGLRRRAARSAPAAPGPDRRPLLPELRPLARSRRRIPPRRLPAETSEETVA